MTKKEKIVLYSSLCVALIIHILLFVVLFFLQPAQDHSQPFENAPVIFDEQAGEVGTSRGTPEGTEVTRESFEQGEEAPTTPEPQQLEQPTEDMQEAQEDSSTESAPQVTPQPEIAAQELPALYQPAQTPRELPRGPIQPDTPIEYAAPVASQSKPKRKRAAWHVVNPEARKRAAGLNFQKSLRTFTDQQYDAYGSPDGMGGTSDHGMGTGGGGNAHYHANINSLDLIKQSYMRKVVRAIVAQSNFMQIQAYSPTPINKVTSWRVEIGPNSKIVKMSSDETCSASIDDALRKIFYATQLPPLPSRLKDGFTWHTHITMRHPAQMAPIILTAVVD